MKIRTIMARKHRDLLTLRPEDTIQTACTLLTTNKIGALPVRDSDGHLVGILSERDIVKGIYKKGNLVPGLLVGELMTRNVRTCAPDDDVKAVMESMHANRFRHMPVVDDGELVGMVSQGDVVQLRLEQSEMEAGLMRDIAIARR
ncbi:MAG: CBS domain-containing protein [Magnetospirillum sp. WYHS-4]